MRERSRQFLTTCLGGLLGLTIGLLPAVMTVQWLAETRAIAQQPEAFSLPQLRQTATAITVRILSGDDYAGSGTLIYQQGSSYQVVTNAHVLTRGRSYQIQAPDGRLYPASVVESVNFGTDDLALLQFQAEETYEIAQLGRASAALRAYCRALEKLLRCA